ncbi:MAG TPA: tRNA lysidine(34) synthetase TilS [Candidatus Dormibacteraeota bacterium]|nr:tRNA lysidine(34) synthetase TilS [Candidatus Dormibacteraeota bacterium]
MARLRREVARALDRDTVLRRGERVVVACSGGPDSTALVDALARLAPPREIDLVVAHVDHGLRPGGGAEADAVADLAAARGLPVERLSVEVGEGPNLQDRARRARHAALRGLAARLGASAIALGHTADDQAETVLMRALRGATPRSLAAMGARDGMLARPLLRAWRADTVAYCRALGLRPLDDPSNADPRHLRTRVRHEVIPVLEAVFPGARRRLVALAERERHAAESRARDTPATRSHAAGGLPGPLVDLRV